MYSPSNVFERNLRTREVFPTQGSVARAYTLSDRLSRMRIGRAAGLPRQAIEERFQARFDIRDALPEAIPRREGGSVGLPKGRQEAGHRVGKSPWPLARRDDGEIEERVLRNRDVAVVDLEASELPGSAGSGCEGIFHEPRDDGQHAGGRELVA